MRVGDATGRAGWAYLRFRELRYEEAELIEIAAALGALSQGGVETFAFFRHGETADAPAAAMRIASLLRIG
mgnify:FL=1